ncbi:MAG: hypothetical protein ACPGJE_03775 [Wenzhouxiangellaceae bacterium]
MHRQLLITLLVALVVVTIARMRRRGQSRRAPHGAGGSTTGQRPSIPVWALVGYSLAAMTILATVAVTWMGYHEGNQIIRVEVIDSRSGERTTYEVRRRDLGDREFRTLDGRFVSLGDSDRMERIEP